MCDHLNHCRIELAVANKIVVIFVDFAHDLVPNLLIGLFEGSLAHSSVENWSEFLLRYHSISVLVKQVECNSEVFFIKQLSSIDSGGNELAIVNLAVMVSVQLVDQVVPVLSTSSHETQNLVHAFLQFVNCQEPVIWCVDFQEHLFHVD